MDLDLVDGSRRVRPHVGDRDALVRDALARELPDAWRLAAWILSDPVAAEDAVAEAMLRAWERRTRLRDVDAASAWFTRILVNACRDALRRRRVRAGVAWRVPPTEVAPDPAGGAGDRDEVARALVRLRDDDRVLLALRFGRDLAVPDIARRLGIREGTVKSRLHGALARCRAEIDAGRRVPEVDR